MKATVSLALIFPLTLFGFAAQNVQHLDALFTGTTRWLLLAALALFLLWRGRLMLAGRSALAGALAAWLGWTWLTTLWSDLPLLSAMKSLTLAASVLALFSGGIYWARHTGSRNPLSYLAPLVGLALFAALFDLGGSRIVNGDVRLFHGLAMSENAFATLIAAALPYPLHAAGQPGPDSGLPRRLAWLLVAMLLIAILVATRSRGGVLAAACVLAAFFFAVLPRKVFVAGVMVALVGGAAGGALMMRSSQEHGVAGRVAHFLGKGHERDLLESRRYIWRLSYEAALEGGVIGVGEGVSAGAPKTFEPGASATGYGREKGDSPLAMVEETGLIGLATYLVLLWRLFGHLARGAAAAVDRDVRMQTILLIGVLAGLLLESLAEAWWTSPAAIESVLFWSTAGVAVGLVRLPHASATAPQRRPARVQGAVGAQAA